jgi:hypothetical protein
VQTVRRPASFLSAAVALLAALAAALPAQAGGTRSVLHYGDSLAVGTDVYLDAFLSGWTIRSSAAVSRHAADVPRALRAFGHALPRVVVLSVGTNDDPERVSGFARIVHETISIAGGSRCIVWSTIARPPHGGVSYEGYNRVLRAAARHHPNLRLLDWASMAKAHPGWFGRDGVHPSTGGYRDRAEAIAGLIRQGC